MQRVLETLADVRSQFVRPSQTLLGW